MGGSWLDRGHGDGASLAPVTGGPAREVVGPTDRGSSSWNSRSTKAIVGALATAALIGSAGTAYAIRETLFPSLGAPTSPSVWSNTPAPVEPAEVTETSVTSSTTTTSSVSPVTSGADTVPAQAPVVVTSVDDHAAEVESPDSRSGTSGRSGSASNTVAPETDDSRSQQHATTTDVVANTGPSVPESGSGGVPTTEGSESGSGSDNSGSGHSGTDDDRSDSDNSDSRDSGDDDNGSDSDDRSDSDD